MELLVKKIWPNLRTSEFLSFENIPLPKSGEFSIIQKTLNPNATILVKTKNPINSN